MGRDRRRSHQAVHDDSRMATAVLILQGMRRPEARGGKNDQEGLRWGERERERKREAVEKKGKRRCGRQRTPAVQVQGNFSTLQPLVKEKFKEKFSLHVSSDMELISAQATDAQA